MNSSIPIIYYHSVADHEKAHPWSFLSIPISVFKAQMKYLSKNNFNTCNWDELNQHLKGLKKLPSKTVMIHFDDGFLDNWTVVYPIMKEYGLKYSILITTEFIQRENEIRPFVKKTQEFNKVNWWGYLNKAEIKIMAESGLVDFQAHGYTHTWHPVSDKVIDVYDGKNFYPHLIWNMNPEDKPYWLTQDNYKVPIGYPVFEFKKSLEAEITYKVRETFIDESIYLYNNYDKVTTIEKLNRLSDKGEYESKVDADKRLEKELLKTRMEISSITGLPCDYIVFPGGGNNMETIEKCKEYGYKLVSKGKELNKFNSNIYQVERLSAVYQLNKFKVNGNLIFLKVQLLRGAGNNFLRHLRTLIKSI